MHFFLITEEKILSRALDCNKEVYLSTLIFDFEFPDVPEEWSVFDNLSIVVDFKLIFLNMLTWTKGSSSNELQVSIFLNKFLQIFLYSGQFL